MSSNDTQRLKTILSDYNLKQLINKPTHQKGHILDWLVVPEESNLWSLEKISNYPGVSDHKAIFSFLHIQHPPKLTRSVSSRNLKAICHHSFENDVRKFINDINIDDSDIDSLTSTYNDGLKNILDNHAPIVTRTIRDRASTEWMNDEAREARRVLRRAERKYRKTNLTVYEDIYKNELKTYRKIKVQLRKQYNSNKISACSTTKQVHVTSDLLLGKKKTKILPDKIEKNLLPENFSKYFTNKIQEIRANLDKNNLTADYTDYNGPSLSSFQQVTKEDIIKIIKSMPTKSCGLDPMPTNMTKEYLNDIVPLTTTIINKSLSSGIAPSKFKEAIVTPILKKKI